jgi:integrase
LIKVPRLKLNRFGVFCLRVIYKDEHGNRKETLQSLGTKEPEIARVLALQFNLSHELQRVTAMPLNKPTLAQFAHLLEPKAKVEKYKIDVKNGIYEATDEADHLRMMDALGVIHRTPAPAQPTIPAIPPIQKSKKISEVIALYSEEKAKDNNKETIKDKKRTYQSLLDLFGDIEINLFTKQELVSWKSTQLKQDIKATTINSKIGELNGLFEYALNNGFYTMEKNPCEGLKIGKASKLKATYESYEPFNNDELKAIFNPFTYSKRLKKPDHYLLPLMALFTGARREELASLKAKNIKIIDDVWSIEIEEGKNENARRIVPIHNKLIELGLLEYAKSIQDKQYPYLFPHLIDGANGRGKNAGRQFSTYLREDLKIENDRKVFHSFRHTVITRLHTINSNKAHVIQLVGHEDDSVHFGTYTHDVGLKALQDTINRLEYDIDFNQLKAPLNEFEKFIVRWKKEDERKLRRMINKAIK